MSLRNPWKLPKCSMNTLPISGEKMVVSPVQSISPVDGVNSNLKAPSNIQNSFSLTACTTKEITNAIDDL